MKSSQSSSLTNDLRGFIRGKTRIVLAWLFAAALLYFSKTPPQTLGIFICFLGATLRFWASGYLRKDTRPAVGGPYAWVRNPLYLGTYVMALGVVLAIQNTPLFVVTSVLFAGVYHFIILDEETKLEAIFGEPYLKYKAFVPRFFPKPWPASKDVLTSINPDPTHLQFSWSIANKNKAYEAYLSFIGLIFLVWITSQIWNWILTS